MCNKYSLIRFQIIQGVANTVYYRRNGSVMTVLRNWNVKILKKNFTLNVRDPHLVLILAIKRPVFRQRCHWSPISSSEDRQVHISGYIGTPTKQCTSSGLKDNRQTLIQLFFYSSRASIIRLYEFQFFTWQMPPI